MLNLALLTFAAAAAVLTVRLFLWWFLPFLPALAAAGAFEPLIRRLHCRLHLRRSFCAALLTLFVLFLFGGLLSLLLSSLLTEARTLTEKLPRLLAALPEQTELLNERLHTFSARCPAALRQYIEPTLSALEQELTAALQSLLGSLLTGLTALAGKLPQLVLALATAFLAVYFSCCAYPTLQRCAERLCAQSERIRSLRSSLRRTAVQFLRVQCVLGLLTFAQLLLGLILLRVDLPLLYALLITVVDALPVFGTGTVLLPWALLSLLLGSPSRAAALLALYLCTLLVRNIAEPRLMTQGSGVPPILSLFAMYVGFCAFGVAGMLLLPFLLLLFSRAYQTQRTGG